MPRRIVGGALLLLAYVAVVVWLTWPLGLNVTTHLPRTSIAANLDGLLSVWALAWESHALVTAPWSLADANIYHPAPHALFYGITGFAALPYFAPVFLATGNPALAMNVTFVGCLALTALTLHLVVRWWTGSHLGGVIAAGVFLTSDFVMWRFIPTAPVYATLQYFPLVAYFAATLSRERGGVRVAVLVALQCMTDMVYVAPAVLAPLGCLAMLRLARPATRQVGIRLLAVLGIAVLALVPIYVGYAGTARDNPGLREQTMWKGVARPVSVPEGLMRTHAATAVPNLILWMIVVGVACRFLRGRHGEVRIAPGAWAHGTLWAVVGIVASLTPIIVWHGIPLRTPQFFLSQWIPALGRVRDPLRLGIAGLIGLAMLAGIAFAECARWIRWGGRSRLLAPVVRAALALGVLVAIYVSYGSRLPREYPLMEAPQMGERLVAFLRAGRGPVLELPVGPIPVDLHTSAMYRSIAHWRPLLNGYASYWPAGFPARMALATALPDPTALAALVEETGLTTIVVRTLFVRPDKWNEWLAARKRGDVDLVAVDGLDYLFEVRSPR